MAIKVGPVTVKMRTAGDRVCYHERNDHGGFEPKSLQCWSEMVQPGSVALDVGAYSGLYAIAAALLGATAVAVEPIPANMTRLKENAELNGVDVITFEAAASDTAGEAKIFAPGSTGLPSGAKIARTSKGHFWGVVKVITLDSLELPAVAAVKMDVERHEVKTLRGASHLFSEFRPALIIESLGDGERNAIEAALPGYCIDEVLDRRNLLMTPKNK